MKRTYQLLTHSDVVEPVEWFVGCSDCHSYRMTFFTTAERLEGDYTSGLQNMLYTIAKEVSHMVKLGETLVGVGMIPRHILTKLSHKHRMTHFTTTSC